MLPKPPACTDCPLYGEGVGFVPDVLVPGARVLILAQNPGESEEKGERIVGYEGGRALTEKCTPQPLIGKTGWALRAYLGQAGLTPAMVSRCNVLKCRVETRTPAGKVKRVNDLPKGKVLREARKRCIAAHFRVPEGTELIVASGALAWQAMGGEGTVTDWRGFLKPEEQRLAGYLDAG